MRVSVANILNSLVTHGMDASTTKIPIEKIDAKHETVGTR